MAKTILSETDLTELRSIISKSPPKISGDEAQSLRDYRCALTDFTSRSVLKHFRDLEGWEQARPIYLGSLARGELCPKSDIDLLFLGEDEAIEKVLKGCDESSLKVAYRKPEDMSDWTVGVEFKDCLNILHAVPESQADRQLVQEQVQRILDDRKFKRGLVKTIIEERAARTNRYGGALHFLEPNLKYSPGSLRDIYQGEIVHILFPEVREEHGHKVLEYYKDFFLILRVWSHLNGGGEVLASTLQLDMSKWLGFNSLRDFMREVQKGFGRASFYSELFVEKASRKSKTLKNISSVPQGLRIILENKDLQAIGKVREFVVKTSPDWTLEKSSKKERLAIRLEFSKIFRSGRDIALQNLFRSRVIDMIFSELKPLIGYVQHDQYHRFTADQHILQALRETASVKASPRKLGKLSKVAGSLSLKEWDILFWTALFHDMAKGREGDHSIVGAEFVERRLGELGFDRLFIEEIKWMVEHHLALSQAAFRENPLDVSTWHKLFDKDLNPERLRRLTVFTAIDVRATNPEAWNSWKEDLLHNLFSALSEGPAESVRELLTHVQKRKNSADFEVLVKNLDPFLVENFSPKTLVEDLNKILKGSAEESIAVHKDKSGKLWIRFFDRSDKKGLFLSYVSRLFLAGVSIDHASIHTLPDGGVYDWFCAGKSKTKSGGFSAQVIARRLMSFPRENTAEKSATSEVKFAEIELVREAPEGALISFRGRDQKGALLEASKGLLAANFEIVWARVHTWGRELDDQFFVKPKHDLHPALQDLRRKLLNH